MRSTGVFTYEDYLQMGDDGQDYELIEGELVVSPSATPFHQEVMLRIGRLFLQMLDKDPGRGRIFAETDVKFPGQSILRPNLA